MSHSKERKIKELYAKIGDLQKEVFFLRVERVKRWREAIEEVLQKFGEISGVNRHDGVILANVLANLKSRDDLEMERQKSSGKNVGDPVDVLSEIWAIHRDEM